MAGVRRVKVRGAGASAASRGRTRASGQARGARPMVHGRMHVPHPSRPAAGALGRGFRAMVPLWLGLVPFALAFAVTARASGLQVLDAQLMSLLVFAGGAQFSAAALYGAGASGAEILLTTFLLNARHLLYGLSLSRRLPLTGARRLVAAHLLTDEAYGVTLASGEPSFAYLLGAQLGVFIPWNVATLLGALVGGALPDPASLGVDFVFPLAFLALLVPLLVGVREVCVAALAGGVALAASRVMPGGLAVLVAAVVGSLTGALWRDASAGGGAGAQP
jgi:4-azaleucine resistance transporter AzlC